MRNAVTSSVQSYCDSRLWLEREVRHLLQEIRSLL